jgi:hypothetical protein
MVIGTVAVCLTVVFGIARAADISGIAISQYSPKDVMKRAANRISWGWNYGKVLRFDVRNGNVTGPTVLYDTYDAHCPRISPSGTRVAFNTSNYRGDPRRPAPDGSCKGKILVINSDGSGQPRELVSGVNCLAWLDWPMEEYVYYQTDYEGSKLYRVNTTGTPKPELLASNFRGEGKSAPDGARYWSISADGKKIGGWFGGSLQYGIIGDGSITWDALWGGCGGSISPDGQVLTRNGGGHDQIFYHSPENRLLDANLVPFEGRKNQAPPALTISDCPGNGTNWHRMHWPVNSSEWVLISMGNGYQIDEGCHPVLLKRDGSECFSIAPLKTDEFYEGSDFWFGDPDNPGQIVEAASVRTAAPSRLTVEQVNGAVRVSSAQAQRLDISLYSMAGKRLVRDSHNGTQSVSVALPGIPGVYVLRVVSPAGELNRSIMVR